LRPGRASGFVLGRTPILKKENGMNVALTLVTDPRAGEILNIIAKETGVDRKALVPDATIEALGIPSLDLIQAVFEIESHFDVEIPVVADRGESEFVTIGGLVGHVLATLDRVSMEKSDKKPIILPCTAA
jgi:acyl carrier protein